MMTRIKKYPTRHKVLHFYVKESEERELCFNVGWKGGGISKKAKRELMETFQPRPDIDVTMKPTLAGDNLIVVGPFIRTETKFSSNAMELLRDRGFGDVTRVEVTRRCIIPAKQTREKFLANEKNFDRMRECVYEKPIDSFDVEAKTYEPLVIVPVIGETLDLLHKANDLFRLGMDLADKKHFHNLFKNKLQRNPTRAELDQIKEMISDHSCHRTFDGAVIINGVRKPYSLMDMVKRPYQLYPGNSVIAFHDNSSAIEGGMAFILTPEKPGWPSRYVEQ